MCSCMYQTVVCGALDYTPMHFNRFHATDAMTAEKCSNADIFCVMQIRNEKEGVWYMSIINIDP